MQLLAADDLKRLGHNTADYVHLVAESLKLSFSDRDAYYGDPDFVDVPLRGLLSDDYTRVRRRDIDPDRAWSAMPEAGDPWQFEDRTQPAESRAIRLHAVLFRLPVVPIGNDSTVSECRLWVVSGPSTSYQPTGSYRV